MMLRIFGYIMLKFFIKLKNLNTIRITILILGIITHVRPVLSLTMVERYGIRLSQKIEIE